MFTWPYFDLSQIWNLSFLLEGHWVAWVWNLLWVKIAFGWSSGIWTYFMSTTGLWSIIIFFVALAVIFIAWALALVGTVFLWTSCWVINYIFWKLFLCLFCMTLWNFAVWLTLGAVHLILTWVIPAIIWFIKAFTLPIFAAAAFNDMLRSPDWRWRAVFHFLYPAYWVGLFFIFPVSWAIWFYVLTFLYFSIFVLEVDKPILATI